MRTSQSIGRMVSLAASVGMVACASVGQLEGQLAGNGDGTVRPTPPVLVSSEVRLVEAPTNQQLAAYYCDALVHVPAPLPSPCMIFGAIPTRADIRFTFAVNLAFRNDNAVPLPMAEALMAFTAFPQVNGQTNLGAVCLGLDQPGDVPPNNPNGCRDRAGDIRTMADFGQAAASFLFAVATGQEHVGDVRVRTIPPHGNAQVTVRLGLDPQTTLGLVQTLSTDAIATLRQGQQPRFAIPYRFQGTLWVNVEHFGRFAVAVPPVDGAFNLQ